MAICGIENGLTSSTCDFTPGGFSELYIANYSNNIVWTEDSSSHVLTAVSMGTSGELFYKFEPGDATTTVTNVASINGQLKSAVIPAVDFTIYGLDQTKLNTLKKLTLGKFVLIVKSKAGTYQVLGYRNGMTSITAEQLGGATLTDPVGLHLVISGLGEIDFGHFFTGTIPQ